MSKSTSSHLTDQHLQLRVPTVVPPGSYSSQSWIKSIFNKISEQKNMESEKPNVIHLLGGSAVLDFRSDSQKLKKIQRESTSEEKKVNKSVTKDVQYENPTVEYGETRVPRNVEELGFLKRLDDQESMDYMVIAVTLFSIVSYIGHFVSDIVTAGILFHRGQYVWAALSVGFSILPIIAINAASLLWYNWYPPLYTFYMILRLGYYQNSLYRDVPSVFCCRLRVFAHCILMGMVCRNVDILINGFRANEELKKPPSFLRGHYFLLYREQRRVTAFLTLIQCFLQDAPQFSLQVYIWTVQNRTSVRFFLKNFHYMQYVSIVFSLVSLCYSVVSYHQTLRYTRRYVLPMNFSACVAQFTWRLGTTGSRLLVIMFSVTAYPYATLVIIAFHWGLMILWLMTQQNTNVLITKFTSKWAEHLYTFLMAGVHIFCFLNVFVNQNRYRLILFYVLQFIEDFAFLCFWYVQLLTEPVHYQSWIYHLGAAIYVNAFAVGIAAMVAFYLILHPNMTEPLNGGIKRLKPMKKQALFKLLKIKLKPTKQHHICAEENLHNNSECSDNESSSDAGIESL